VKKGTCTHFSGVFNERCKRGVGYEINFGGSKPGWFLRAPCVRSREDLHGNSVPHDRRGEVELPCMFREEPTDAQIESADREFEDMLRNVKVSLALASGWRVRPKPDADRETTVECPVCKTGRLRMTQSAYNGHVHGRCDTDGCVHWME